MNCYTGGIKISFRRNPTYFVLSIILIIIASSRGVGFDRDSVAYYNASLSGLFDPRWIEPSFSFISAVNNYLFFSSQWTFFLMYASIAILLKFIAFPRITEYLYSTVFLYITSYFLILELTQIRAAVAVAFFLLAIDDIVNKRPEKYFIKILLAMFFHYSAVIYLPLYFINTERLSKFFWGSLPFFSIGISYIIDANLLLYVTPDFLLPKVNNYLTHLEPPPLLNLYRLSLLVVYLFFIIYSNAISSRVFNVLLKILGLSLAFYYAFSNLGSVFSVRFSGLLSVVLVILIPFLFKIFKQKCFVVSLIVVYGIINLYYLLYVQKIFSIF